MLVRRGPGSTQREEEQNSLPESRRSKKNPARDRLVVGFMRRHTSSRATDFAIRFFRMEDDRRSGTAGPTSRLVGNLTVNRSKPPSLGDEAGKVDRNGRAREAHS